LARNNLIKLEEKEELWEEKEEKERERDREDE
jgi:hypothetical protein